MRTEPDEITRADYKRLAAKQPRRAKREPRADIPRAPRDAPTGLTALLRAGWSIQGIEGHGDGVRLYIAGGADTGYHATLKAACDKAKELSK